MRHDITCDYDSIIHKEYYLQQSSIQSTKFHIFTRSARIGETSIH